MRVVNQFGREMEMSKEDYLNLIESGVNLTIVETDLKSPILKDTKAYTSICGDYDIKRDDITIFRGEGNFAKSVMEAKVYKVLPHQFLPDKEETIWIDGNIFLNADENETIKEFLDGYDIAIFQHPFRDTVYEEFAELKKDPRFSNLRLQKKLKEQEERYLKEGLPKDQPLFECNMIIRRNNPKVNRLMDAWWAEICRHSWRDQVSFPYVIWKYGKDLKINAIKGNIRKNKWFKHIEMYA
jgi:hypothetical protein